MKEKKTATALSFVLGGLGVHKFYLEQHGWGCLYLAFCWTLVPVVAGVVEGVRFLRMSPDDFYQRYNAPQLPTRLPEHGMPAVPFLQPNVNVVVNTGQEASADDVPGRIARLHDLLEKGALTQAEFDREKAKILDGDPS